MIQIYPSDLNICYKVQKKMIKIQCFILLKHLIQAMACPKIGKNFKINFKIIIYIFSLICSYFRTIDWSKSYEFYQKILNMGDEENAEDSGYFEANSECDPLYVILARMAEMNLNGGNNFDKDPNEAASLYTEAGDKAMACGKGRLANKYYMLSEEAASCAD